MKSAISKGKLKLKRTGPDPMASAKSTPKQRSTLPGTVLEAIKPANVKKVLRCVSPPLRPFLYYFLQIDTPVVCSEHARQLQSAVAFDSDGSHDADLADFMHDCTDIATL